MVLIGFRMCMQDHFPFLTLQDRSLRRYRGVCTTLVHSLINPWNITDPGVKTTTYAMILWWHFNQWHLRIFTWHIQNIPVSDGFCGGTSLASVFSQPFCVTGGNGCPLPGACVPLRATLCRATLGLEVTGKPAEHSKLHISPHRHRFMSTQTSIHVHTDINSRPHRHQFTSTETSIHVHTDINSRPHRHQFTSTQTSIHVHRDIHSLNIHVHQVSNLTS